MPKKNSALESARTNKLKIVDATQAAILCVNAKDVKAGDRKNPQSCAMARAIKRNYPTIRAAYFNRTTAWLEYDDKIVRYRIPVSAQKEIVAFDRGATFEPGNYQLTPPQPSTPPVGRPRDKGRKRSGPSGKRTTKARHVTMNVRAL